MSQRDPLTGEPLRPGSLRIVVKADRMPGSPPLQLHNRVVCHDGSRQFTRPALRAMRDRTIQPADHTYHWNHWWNIEGVESALYAYFPRLMVTILYCVKRENVEWDMALQGTGLQRADIEPYIRGMALWTRQNYLPDEYANE